MSSAILSDCIADRLLTLDLIADQASRLRDLLARLDILGGTGGKHAMGHRSETPPSERLYAASGLGLVAKNVRNVAALQAAHLPRLDQKGVALRLSADIHAIAVTARDTARRAFGLLDDACRVRPARTPTMRVITHDKVDGDAVASAWLAERLLFAGESVEVLFLPRERVLGAYRRGDCLLDVGNTHNASKLFFDLKIVGGDRHADCAAGLVWKRLVALRRPVMHLRSLVDVVFAGDSRRAWASFRSEYEESKRTGFHQALADAKGKYDGDADVYRAMRQWLDKYHKRAATRKG